MTKLMPYIPDTGKDYTDVIVTGEVDDVFTRNEEGEVCLMISFLPTEEEIRYIIDLRNETSDRTASDFARKLEIMHKKLSTLATQLVIFGRNVEKAIVDKSGDQIFTPLIENVVDTMLYAHQNISSMYQIAHSFAGHRDFHRKMTELIKYEKENIKRTNRILEIKSDSLDRKTTKYINEIEQLKRENSDMKKELKILRTEKKKIKKLVGESVSTMIPLEEVRQTKLFDSLLSTNIDPANIQGNPSEEFISPLRRWNSTGTMRTGPIELTDSEEYSSVGYTSKFNDIPALEPIEYFGYPCDHNNQIPDESFLSVYS